MASLQLHVVSGSNLAPADITGKSDPLVKASIKQDVGPTQRARTASKLQTLNPVWNERLELGVFQEGAILRLDVFDRDAGSADDFLGFAEVQLSQYPENQEVKLNLDLQPDTGLSKGNNITVSGSISLTMFFKRPTGVLLAPPQVVAEMVTDTTGMTGIGMVLSRREDQTDNFYVAMLQPGSPAESCGRIRINDVLVEINKVSVRGKPLADVHKYIMGKPGTTVTLVFMRDDKININSLGTYMQGEMELPQVQTVRLQSKGLKTIVVTLCRRPADPADTSPIQDQAKQSSQAKGLLGQRNPQNQSTSQPPLPALPPAGANKQSLVGVGLGIAPHTDGRFLVMKVLPGTSGALKGVQLGDEVIAVDGQTLEKQDLEGVRSLVLGDKGTFVNMCFRRQSQPAFELDLMRGGADFISKLQQGGASAQIHAEYTALQDQIQRAKSARLQVMQARSTQESARRDAQKRLSESQRRLQGLQAQLLRAKQEVVDVRKEIENTKQEALQYAQDAASTLADENKRTNQAHEALQRARSRRMC